MVTGVRPRLSVRTALAPKASPRLAVGEQALPSLTHVTLSERVYAEMRKAFMTGAFAAGSTLTIRGLADQLGTSVMPVREAVRRLAAEGALTIVPNRSIHIPPMTNGRVAELCHLRMLIEGDTAAQAANRLTPEEFELIRGYHQEFEAGVRSGNASKLLQAGENLHFAIYVAARSPVVVQVISMLWLQTGPLLAEPMRRIFKRREVVSFAESVGVHHQRIIEALEKGNGELAAKAVRAEIRYIVDQIQTLS